MSTRAIIGIQNENGSITGGWQWNDGMGLAPLLCRQFNTRRIYTITTRNFRMTAAYMDLLPM